MVQLAAGGGTVAGNGATAGGEFVTTTVTPKLAPVGLDTTTKRPSVSGDASVAGGGVTAGGELGVVTSTSVARTTPSLAAVSAAPIEATSQSTASLTPALSTARVAPETSITSAAVDTNPKAAPVAASWTQPTLRRAGGGSTAGGGLSVGGVTSIVSATTQTVPMPALAPVAAQPPPFRPNVAGEGATAGNGRAAGSATGPYTTAIRSTNAALAPAAIDSTDRIATFVFTIEPEIADAKIGVLAGTGLAFNETVLDHLFVTLARADGVSVSFARADGVSVSLGLRRRGENPDT